MYIGGGSNECFYADDGVGGAVKFISGNRLPSAQQSMNERELEEGGVV